MNQLLNLVSKRIAQSEPWLFLIVALASLIPLFLLHYVGSLDGPKHLSASNMLGQLLMGNDSFSNYFTLNPLYIGNVLGIYMLSLLNLVLPAWMAEKVFIACYLLSFVYGFRYLIKSINDKSTLFSLLIFPFTHTSLFMMGYYNFSLAIGLLFFALGYWIRHHRSFSRKSLAILGLLLLLTYLAHIFVFFITIFLIALAGFADFFISYRSNEKQSFKDFRIMAIQTIVAALPSLILSFFYVIRIVDFQQSNSFREGDADKLADLMSFRMLVGYDMKAELPLTSMLLYFFASLTAFILIWRIATWLKQPKDTVRPFWSSTDSWLVITLLFLFLYFVLPDGTDAAASVGMRMLILTSVLWALWIGLQRVPTLLGVFPLVGILLFGFQSRAIHLKYLKPLDQTIRQIEVFEKHLPANSLVVTMNFSKNWLMHYFHNYFGMEQAVVDLKSNACSPFMAFDWRNKKPEMLTDAAKEGGFTGYPGKDGKLQTATHVVIFEYRWYLKEETLMEFRSVLDSFYVLSHVSDNQMLAIFERRN
ncbi:MAG: hypothetical protein FD155_1018 [Bacteroidetes bacterium]|nr:MAG: hypothetical protein FD155_1018 [Bacteroidota bacterium]